MTEQRGEDARARSGDGPVSAANMPASEARVERVERVLRGCLGNCEDLMDVARAVVAELDGHP